MKNPTIKQRLLSGARFNLLVKGKIKTFAGVPEVFYLKEFTPGHFSVRAEGNQHEMVNVLRVTEKILTVFNYDVMENKHEAKVLTSNINFL